MLLVVVATLVLGACSLESPVEATNRPLAERLADRRAAAADAEQAALEAVEAAEGDATITPNGDSDVAPEAIAFGDVELFDTPGLVLVVDGNAFGVELKDGPGSGYRMIADIPYGSELVTLGAMTGEWTYVAYGDFDGWVFSQLTSLADASGAGTDPELLSEPTTYVVSDDVIGVNMRLGPSSDTELVSGAPAGSVVEGTGRTKDDWVEVTFNGVTGWAHGRYLIVE